MSAKISTFVARELRQGAHLAKALVGRHQMSFTRPRRELRRLKLKKAVLLIAHNPHSRCLWFKSLVRHLGNVVEAKPPSYQLGSALYFVTIIDRNQTIDPDFEWNGEGKNPTWAQMKVAYSQHLFGFDYIGMLDSALFVSTQRVFNKPRLINVHLHALIWNTDEAALDAAATRLAVRQVRPLYSYAKTFDCRPVCSEDFLQVVWYMSKAPYKQYQLSTRDTGRIRQYRGPINLINSVRLYATMRNQTLDRLTLAGGRGYEVLQCVRKDCGAEKARGHKA